MKKVILIITIVMLSMFFVKMDVVASDTDVIMDQFAYEEIDEELTELFPEERLNFKDTVYDLIDGDLKLTKELAIRLLKDQFTYAFRVNKKNLVQILLLAIMAAIFTNFSHVLQSKHISEISFYVVYMLLLTLCLHSFQVSIDWVSEGTRHITSFMKVLCPVYFLAVAIAKGSVTAVAFYNIALFLIFLIEIFVVNVLIPVIHLYIMVRLMNDLTTEDYLSKLGEFMEIVISWILKTLLALVVGMNVIQGLIAPAIDTVKRSALTRGMEAIPGIGDALGGTTEVLLGTAVLVKNGIGMAGLIICIALCVIPLIQVAIIVLLYKLVAALIQPISDKRIVGCVASVGEGCQLLMRVIFTVAVLFLLTIGIVAATTSNV